MDISPFKDQQQMLNGMLPPSYNDSTNTTGSMEPNSMKSNKNSKLWKAFKLLFLKTAISIF